MLPISGSAVKRSVSPSTKATPANEHQHITHFHPSGEPLFGTLYEKFDKAVEKEKNKVPLLKSAAVGYSTATLFKSPGNDSSSPLFGSGINNRESTNTTKDAFEVYKEAALAEYLQDHDDEPEFNGVNVF